MTTIGEEAPRRSGTTYVSAHARSDTIAPRRPGPGRPGRERPGKGRADAERRTVAQRRRSRVRMVVRGAGEVLITFGLVVLFFAVYEVYGKTAAIDAHQNELSQQLDQTWSGPSGEPPTATPANPGVPPGGSLARLYIPRLKMHWVVVEGVSLHDIAWAPGHYPGTALPGQVGNFAIAGHRVPAIFWNLQEVQPGDHLIVETRTEWLVYRVTVNEIVTPHSIEVIAPTPDHPQIPPSVPMMTLTTCNPKWDNYQRMVVHAVLIGRSAQKAGPPEDLGS